MPALSAPATRTTFQLPRRPRATPRITVLRKPTQILDSVIVEQCESEDEEEDGAQYATFPAMEGTEETVLNIGAIRERQEKRRDNIFESKVLDKLERRKALANGGGRIDLAKAAAAGSLRVKDGVPHPQPRGHRHTQSLNIHPLSDPFSPASPPSSPPVFNFSSLTSPTAFTSAVSPHPSMPNFSHNPLYNYLVEQNMIMAQLINSLPPVEKPQHIKKAQQQPVHNLKPQRQPEPTNIKRAHKRTGSLQTGGGSLSSLPSLDQIAAHLSSTKSSEKKPSPVQAQPTISISGKMEEVPPTPGAGLREKRMTEFLKRRTRERSSSGSQLLDEEGPLKKSPKVAEAELKSPSEETGGRRVAAKRMVNTLMSGRRNRFSMIDGITC